jgi:hypothetical protein
MANWSPVPVAWDLDSVYWSVLRLEFQTSFHALELRKEKRHFHLDGDKLSFLMCVKRTLNLLISLDQMLNLFRDGKGTIWTLAVTEYLRATLGTGADGESPAGFSVPRVLVLSIHGQGPGMEPGIVKQMHIPPYHNQPCSLATC